jgi:hypothetical protein
MVKRLEKIHLKYGFMKQIIFFLTLIILFTNCKKDKVTHTIKGKYISCVNAIQTPIANSGIDLFQQRDGSNYKSQVLGNTVTDAQGNFTFTYTTDNTRDLLIIRESSGFGFNRIIEDIPVGKDVNDIRILSNGGIYNLVVRINVIKTYINLDTLFVQDFRNTNPNVNPRGLPIAGPFYNSRLYAVSRSAYPLKYNTNKDIIYYSLNNLSSNPFSKEFTIENSKLCGDTVYVNLDIK